MSRQPIGLAFRLGGLVGEHAQYRNGFLATVQSAAVLLDCNARPLDLARARLTAQLGHQFVYLGQTGGGVEKSEAGKPSHSGTRESATASVKCTGSCSSSSGSTSLTFKGTRQLSEGVAVTIRDGKAKFSFHQLVETNEGASTKVRIVEFRIDRPLIELELEDHDVVVATAMDESERTDRIYTRKGVAIE